MDRIHRKYTSRMQLDTWEIYLQEANSDVLTGEPLIGDLGAFRQFLLAHGALPLIKHLRSAQIGRIRECWWILVLLVLVHKEVGYLFHCYTCLYGLYYLAILAWTKGTVKSRKNLHCQSDHPRSGRRRLQSEWKRLQWRESPSITSLPRFRLGNRLFTMCVPELHR